MSAPLTASTMTPPPRATATFQFQGKTVTRRAGFVQGTKLTCIAGHAFTPHVGDSKAVSCYTRTENGYCGARLYVLVIPGMGSRSRSLWAVDVDGRDLYRLEKMTSVQEILTYFGQNFPEAA